LFSTSQALLLSQNDSLTEDEYKIFEYIGWYPKKDFKIIKSKETVVVQKNEELFPEIESEFLFDQNGLQEYILLCCQKENGGLCDKPGKSRDFYHTSYSLSGLSISQHCPSGKKSVLGKSENLLNEISPIHNLCKQKVKKVLDYFKDK